MRKKSRIAIYIYMSMCLAGCSLGETTPMSVSSPAIQTSPPVVVNTESAITPTAKAMALNPKSQTIGNPEKLLESAVVNLQNAGSFQMAANEMRAYKSIEPGGATKIVYGEFHTNYAVIRVPTLKIHAHYEYRYDPQADFENYDSYTFQENDRYFSRLVEVSTPGEYEAPCLLPCSHILHSSYTAIVTSNSHTHPTGGTNTIRVENDRLIDGQNPECPNCSIEIFNNLTIEALFQRIKAECLYDFLTQPCNVAYDQTIGYPIRIDTYHHNRDGQERPSITVESVKIQ
jgi:hypothetical protein